MLRVEFVFLLLISVLTARSQTSPKTGLTAEVDKVFQKWDSTVTPGCALAVMKNGNIIYKRGYGMADLDHDVPIRASTVFQVGSVSKQFTAAAIVLLAQQGKLSLDEDVRKYIPEVPDFGTPIRLRNLIHHTSGLPEQFFMLRLAGWRYLTDLVTDQDVLDVLAEQKNLNFRPGEKHLYCNTGYTLLAQIVKRVSGKSFREFTDENIFRRLGMTSTHFRDDHTEVVKNLAVGYERAKNGTFRLSTPLSEYVGPTNLLTTVEDFALWDQNFYDKRVGGEMMIDQMLERGRLDGGEQINYAFGLLHREYRGLRLVGHGGSDGGYNAAFYRFPEQQLSVACLCNVYDTATQLALNVASIYLAKELQPENPKPPPRSKLSEAQLSKYQGTYRLGEQVWKIVAKDGNLQTSRQGVRILEAVAENRFRLQGLGVELRFDTAAGVRKLITTQAGKEEVFELAPEFSPTTEQLQEFAGAYHSIEIDPIYSVVVQHGKLQLKRPRNPATELQPAVQDLFNIAEFGAMWFRRDAQGRITGFVLYSGDRRIEFAK